ncbi:MULTISPECIES: mechanosensitive ion channel domain-containing protein [Acidobacteriaceae]|uniref:mechanosensitive ion channel domain-containing protein n=1 Tax=Acidobacteriaceae TaxID=204434 RepID=UPI0020B11951|nr:MULTISPECIES: mechanosensitive ion channel domain-containing protein [Acidobacteriaceae]MDW5264645.1 mechanosensitive ion channel [Edaphobacter sp.]
MRKLLIVVPAAALVVLLIASYLTRGSMANLPFLRGKRGASADTLVDQRPWQTAQALASLATSVEEKRLARNAERLADHEVDQAFAQALRMAALQPPVLKGDALALSQKVAVLKETVKEDQATVDRVTAATAKLPKAPDGTVQSDELDAAKAQLTLDNDELGDATDDLARVSGDKRGAIQQELTAREASMKKFDEQADSGAPTAVASAKQHGTLYGRMKSWFDQRSRMDLISQAKAEADADVVALTAQHAEIEKKASAAEAGVVASPSGTGTPTDAEAAVRGRVARMGKMHAIAQVHSILDDRLQTQQQLSGVYDQWLAQVELQHSIVTHLLFQSFAVIAFLLLCAALLGALVRMMLDRSKMEQRSLHTLRMIAHLAIQFVTLVLVLLVIFGTPSQTPTILGLATAGLTVVFQDFILAFFGWFVLMGKNGIRVGDWVEINGMAGEVIEIGVFRTSLLETGNWSDKGHPTGRRVTFLNKYAITGQFLNFSTTGQWMWDEISLNVPAGEDTFKMIDEIHEVVLKETKQGGQEAEREWQRATKQTNLSLFSATPSVEMRPAGSGIDILVRYVTQAGNRFEMRNRLYQSVINLLHKTEEKTALPAESKS